MMKKITLLISSLLLGSLAFSQSTQSGLLGAGHVPAPASPTLQYLGWQNGAIPLYFRTGNHNGNQNRMLIYKGAFGLGKGRVAMGNRLPNNFYPQARLHLHQNGNANSSNNRTTIKFTSSRTGDGSGDGFEVGYNSESATLSSQFAEIRNYENSAIKFFTTGGLQRMHINQSRISQLGFTNLKYTVPTSGYVGIGRNTSNIWGNVVSGIGRGPYSLLHLNNDRWQAEESGYRPWMRGGVTFTENVDLAYVGFRPFFDGSGLYQDVNLIDNENEFTIAWSNNATIGPQGSDDMVFRFLTTTTTALQHSISNDLTTAEDFDGLHIARFTAAGNMGLGPTFGQNNALYVLPQSLFHASRNDSSDTWLQVTNQFGTEQTATDGLRIGITGTGTAHIKQQEDLPLIFYTANIEDARIEPATASTLPATNHGMMGIGDWTTAVNVAAPIDAKLDIDGDLRIRTVTEDSTLVQVLVIDSSDHNRVHWMDVSNLGGVQVTADDGLSIDPSSPNNVQLGQEFIGPAPAFTGPASLLQDREVPLDSFNLHFTGLGTQGVNQVSVGTPSPIPVLTGDTNLTSKFSTYNEDDAMAGSFLSDEINYSFSTNGFPSNGQWVQTGMIGVTGAAIRRSSDFVTGVYGTAAQGTNGSAILRGVLGQIRTGGSGPTTSIGVHGIGENTNGGNNYGGYFEGFGSPDRNYGVYCTAPVLPVPGPGSPPENLALWADGDAFVSGTTYLTNPAVIISDQQFKTNVDSIQNALSLINQLMPKTFEFDTTTYNGRIHFKTGIHYGFVAQEVEVVLPELISPGMIPAVLDSLGNVSEPAIPYKSLNYNAFIAILMKGMQEQQSELNAKDSAINDLETRLAALENCLNNILPILCQINNSMVNKTSPDVQSELGALLNVELTDGNNIVLNQNVPNPFAEQTIISFVIPATVNEAQLMFYNSQGRLIQQMEITERGKGSVNVYANDLSSGIYTYSLIADGKLITTKKMVKQ